jgi:hypothetical protein
MEQALSEEIREQEEVWAEAAAEAVWVATVRVQAPEVIAYAPIVNYPYRIR